MSNVTKLPIPARRNVRASNAPLLKQLVRRGERQEVTQFNPERFRLGQAAADFTIEEAKRIKNWPALEEAVDIKMIEQAKFVTWWVATVGFGRPEKVSEDADTYFSVAKAEKLTGMTKQRVSALKTQMANPESYRSHLLGAGYLAAYLEMPAVRGTQGTGENEWFTPAEYLELVRNCLGAIDLDPASNPQAQKVIKAKTFYTEDDDGLAHKWGGRVWLNPPYAQPLIGNFVAKLVSECAAKHVTSAILLTHNYTDTEWFHLAANAASAICFTRGRVKFYKPDGTVAAPTQGQAFFYFGGKVNAFKRVFGEIGFVVHR